MPYRFFKRFTICVAAVTLPFIANAKSATIEFDRDVRPILSDNCFYCHGSDPNHRKAKMRLDTAEGAAAKKAFVPGKPEESELIRRIFSKDPDEHMPPPDSNRHLTDEQKEILRAWIQQGGKYGTHWAFIAPVRPELPKVKNKKWPRNEIDYFVLSKLESEKIKPNPEAPLEKLLRRVSLDLDGLPPTPEQLKNWRAQKDPFSAAVDELLASPHFGERMASDWLDVARYADTHGFNNDSARSMWRWRDWVIKSFNENMPYDQFITEQLAGDLLKNATLDEKIASGFNRNHVINSEGGIIDEEYRVEYVADRVRTTSMAWLGMTMECARCHDHKFDPITQKDYYRMFAFFNNVDEFGEDGRIANASPFIPAPTEKQQKEIAEQRAIMKSATEKMNSLLAAKDWKNVSFDALATNGNSSFEIPNVTNVISFQLPENFDSKAITNLAGGKPFHVSGKIVSTNGPMGNVALNFDGKSELKTAALPKSEKTWALAVWVRRDQSIEAPIFTTMNYGIDPSSQSYGRGVEIRFTKTGAVEVRTSRRWPAYSAAIVTRKTIPVGEWHHLLVACDGSEKAAGLRVFVDGEEFSRDVTHDDFAISGISGDAVIGASNEKGVPKFAGALADFRLISKTPKLESLVAKSRRKAVQFFAKENNFTNPTLQRAWLAKNDPTFSELENSWRKARAKILEVERDAPTVMVMNERTELRPTFLLSRGQYDLPKERVEPGMPDFIMPFSKSLPRNRLGLAKWFTDPKNPLTARVVVNRFWQSIFGAGIVKTPENFGYQSEWPSHPELLDWLATDFVKSGWDVKRLLRLMVMSATYREDSFSTPELNERDPENRLLARAPRHRLSAEMLRDQVLSISGLLHDEIGGPPVFPYQPTNLYKGIVVAADYPGTKYVESKGDELYRRSLYGFWKRTVPNPTLATFDAPERDVCIVKRPITNTPLQALALMNDTIQLEAAREFAERMIAEGGSDADDRINFAFRLATAREPASSERRTIVSLLEKRLAFYRGDVEAAKSFISVGDSKPDANLDPAELAAYANVASLILNLDETITRN